MEIKQDLTNMLRHYTWIIDQIPCRLQCRLCCLTVNTLAGPKPWDYTRADGYLSE